MNMSLPGLIITGASGFVGRHFLRAVEGRFRLFCIARRSQFEAGLSRGENQRWTQVDIGNREELLKVARCVQDHGGADYMLHLAGYYDFNYADHPEYTRTNVEGTRNVLALADEVGIDHFVFSSSLAACRFPDPGVIITEDSAPDADFPYARSKREAESIIERHPAQYRKSVLRLAALFSDWCEYPPVYAFLNTWASDRWNARVLGGKGESAVPYLHIRDLTALLLKVIAMTDALPAYGVYNASPSHTTSHLEIFRAATRFLFGEERRPLHIPSVLARPGVFLRESVLTLFGHPPFERSWMLRYIDRDLRVDAQRTHALLQWKPTPRYDLTRRLLILIENMKHHPEVWTQRNEAAFVHAASRPNLVLYTAMLHQRDAMVTALVHDIRSLQQRDSLTDYDRMNDDTLRAYVSLFYEVLITSIRTRDRSTLRNYARVLAYHRHQQGFDCRQVCTVLTMLKDGVRSRVAADLPENVRVEDIHDYINLSVQLACDEVEEVFEQLQSSGVEPAAAADTVNVFSSNAEMQRLIDELHDVCRDGWEIKGIFEKTGQRSR